MHEYHELYKTTGGILPVRCGFCGIYSESVADAAMYVAMDEIQQNVIVIPLTTNFYWTAIRWIADSVSFQNVYIAIPTLSSRVMGDIVNLMIKMLPIKHTVKFIFPEPIHTRINFNDPVTMAVMPNILRMTSTTDRQHIIGLDCSIVYESLGDYSGDSYGIVLLTNHGRHLFLDNIPIQTAGQLCANIVAADKRGEYRWISMPWRVPAYGGVSMYDILNGANYNGHFDAETIAAFQEFSERFKGRLVPYRFSCTEELQEARTTPGVNVPARLVI